MALIGTFTAQDNGYAGTVRTLTLNVKVKIVPSQKESDKVPDYRIVAGAYEIGAAWKKVSLSPSGRAWRFQSGPFAYRPPCRIGQT